jgi:hypothetical protein
MFRAQIENIFICVIQKSQIFSIFPLITPKDLKEMIINKNGVCYIIEFSMQFFAKTVDILPEKHFIFYRNTNNYKIVNLRILTVSCFF